MRDAYLILEDGSVFKGLSFGYDGETIGELVFSTDMNGYLETLSDPAYYGQILLQTFPLIGNYGVIPNDFGTGQIHLKAYIVRDWCQDPSNFRSEGDLDSFLREMMIPGIYSIDTRRLTRIIRDKGVMNAMVSRTIDISEEKWTEIRSYKVTDAVASVNAVRMSSNKPAAIDKSINSSQCVAVLDFGDAYRYIQALKTCGCTPVIAPLDSSVDDILSLNPNGLFLSGGPGDPTENTQIIERIRELSEKCLPMLAVGLGHQMLALAHGAKTEKLRFGHRGANQPVKCIMSNRSFITTQNHGYSVISDSLPDNAFMSYVNVNDGTCEGIVYKDIKAFSVQFDPHLNVFSEFALMIESEKDHHDSEGGSASAAE